MSKRWLPVGFFALFILSPVWGANKFTPPSGKILLMIGQDTDSVRDYLKAVNIRPAGLMSYTNIDNLSGLRNPDDPGGGVQHAQFFVDVYPDTALQIGLYMVDSLEKVCRGELDKNLDRFARWLKATKRPVFLRIGYEYDFPQNRYNPSDYIKAYRYIVNTFRKKGVGNVAYVWHSYAGEQPKRVMEWYPGDDYVDWVGISFFNQFQKYQDQGAEVARKLGKPLMLAETSPWHMKNTAERGVWFKRLFKFIETYNVQALCYINTNWDFYPMWAGMNLGDTRVEAVPDILKLWTRETSQDKYLQSSPQLFNLIGYKNPK